MISLAILLTQLLFGDLRLVTTDSLPAEAMALGKPTGPYSAEVFQAYTSSLKHLLDEQGYWYSELNLGRVEIDSTSNRIHIDLNVRLNSLVRIEFLRLEGAGDLPEPYLLAALRFTSGRVATLDELNRLRTRLLASGDLSEVSEPRLISADGGDGVLFEVKRASRHRSDVLIGYADGEVIGQVDLRLRHLISPGSRFDVRFHRLKAYQNRLNLDAGYGFASGSFRLFQQDSTYFTRAWMLGADVDVTLYQSVGAYVEQQTTILGITVPGVDAEAGSRLMTGLRYAWQSPRGNQWRVSSGVGRRDGRPVQAAQSDWMLRMHTDHRWNWAWLGSAAAMIADRIPFDDLYRFGGATSFRGYREDELQASRFAWTELESRFMLDSQSYAFVFAGSAGMTESSLLFNAGIGFSTPTRLGPLRFTYAGSSQRGLLQGVVHVSLSNGL